MENYTLDHDIFLVCMQATSFPNGVQHAFEKLLKTDPSFANRALYGISRGSNNGIVYWAAVEEAYRGEGYTFGLDQYTVKKGVYASEKLTNISGNEMRIGRTFEKLLQHPALDPLGECVERYTGADEVVCMVRLKE